jgi:O-antigen ligase
LIMLSSASSSETSPLGLLAKLISDAKLAFSDLPKWERVVHVFWLLGPFILLIERTPADLWLSLLGLIFVGRSIARRDGAWLRHFWVRAAFVFWAVCLLSAALSSQPSYALGEAFVWFRFPLFAMATAFWLGQDKRLLYAMLLSTGLGMMVMTGILTAEILIEGLKGGRLTWPYDDLVPGNYLAKVGLPAFVVMVALAIGARRRMASVMGALSLITIVMSILAGERINFIIRACAGMLAGMVWKLNKIRFFTLVIVELIAIFSIFYFADATGARFTNQILNDFPTGPHSDYYRVMGAGIVAFLEHPLLGVGTANYRELCPEILAEYKHLRCDNHPHNYYIQFLTETGVIGFLAGVVMIGAIIWKALVASFKNRENVVVATAFVIPFGLFFPIQSTADFFGQWNNIFMWSAVALSMAAANLLKE